MLHFILFFLILSYPILTDLLLLYSILFYPILFYSILFCSVLLYSILFYSILFYSILFFLANERHRDDSEKGKINQIISNTVNYRMDSIHTRVYFARPTIAIAKIRDYSQSRTLMACKLSPILNPLSSLPSHPLFLSTSFEAEWNLELRGRSQHSGKFAFQSMTKISSKLHSDRIALQELGFDVQHSFGRFWWFSLFIWMNRMGFALFRAALFPLAKLSGDFFNFTITCKLIALKDWTMNWG